MEKFIIGLFSQQLETYIEGFRKEQVTANLLNGKGEISHVHIKVKPVNDILKRYTHLVELSSVYISKLSFNVTSLRNIKKAPIEIYIDEVHVVLVEPLEYCGPNDASWPILAKSIVEKAKKKGPYGLMERIQDNITLDINRIYLTFQPMGKFKTRQFGKWTPPAISVVLNYLRFVSVDEYGDEGSPDDVWRHNTRMGREEALLRKQMLGFQIRHRDDRRFWHRTLMIYKKLTMEMSIAIGHRNSDMSAKDSFQRGHLLLANVPMQTHICIHRRVPNNAILAVQIDVSIMRIELDFRVDTIPLLIHALVGIQNCFKKQSFKDPFESRKKVDSVADVAADAGPSIHSIDATTINFENNSGDYDAISNIEFSSDDSDSEASRSGDEEEGVEGNHDDVPTNEHDMNSSWPALVLPAGLIIMEKIGFSFSVHHLELRINHVAKMGGGHIQVSVRGLVSEVIWPKARDGSLGGYVQLSLAYVNIQEQLGKITTRILQGGNQINSYGTSVKETTTLEEMFPMFEQALIRIDPDNLRCTFPVQVFGLKVSIDVVGKELMIGPSSQFSITNEIGINDVNITILPSLLIRLQQLVEQGSKDVDERWFSGNWGREAKIDNMDKYIYIPPSGNSLFSGVSPRNINVTARLSAVEVVVPPAKDTDDEQNYLLLTIPDITFLVSSSLPRMFLSEDIPNKDDFSFYGKTLLPNEYIDSVYQDGSLSQVARVQLTLNEVALKVLSPIFSHDASRAETLFSASKMVLLGSLENSEETIRGALKHMFVSFLCQEMNVHIDVGVLSLAATILLSYRSFVETLVVSRCNVLPLCNVTTRLSTNDITVSLLTSYHGTFEGDKRSVSNSELSLNLRLDGIEISFQIYHCYNDTSWCVLCKGQVAKTSIYPRCTISEDPSVADTPSQKISFNQNYDILSFGTHPTEKSEGFGCISFRFDVDSSGVLKCGATISNGDIYFSQNTFDTFSSMMVHFEHEEIRCYLKQFIETKNGVDSNSLLKMLKFMIASIQIKKVHLHMQDTIEPRNHSVNLDELAFQIGYRANKDIAQTYRSIWNEFYQDDIPGFHYRLLSRIKFYSYQNNLSATELGIFSFDGHLRPSKFSWEIQDCKISFDELSLINHWKALFLNTHERNLILFRNVVQTFVSDKDSLLDGLSTTENDKDHSPLLRLFDSSTDDLSRAKYRLQTARSKIKESLIGQNRAVFGFKREIERLHGLLLHSELRHLAALSSVSHDMSGFLRVSSTAISGQRFVSATSFWNYYVVLRKSYLILLKDTTHEKPFAVIHLDGAIIRSVAGSGARHVFSKAFAIVERNGKETFFLAPSFADVERWIGALHSSSVNDISQHNKDLPSVDDPKMEGTFPMPENPEMMSTLCSPTDMDLIEQKSSTDSYTALDNTSSLMFEDEADDTISRGSKGSKFRDKMAKLKTSVRNNVRTMNENVKSIKLDRSGPAVFSRSQVNSSAGSSRSSNELPFRVKHLRATEEVPQTKENINITREQKLLVLPGIFKCDVSVTINAVDTVGQNDTPEQQCLYQNFQLTISISRKVLSALHTKTSKVILKSFSELLVFHTKILSILTTIEKDPRAADISMPNGGILDSQELFPHVISCGKALQGHLTLTQRTDGHSFKYLDVVTSEFLDALLSCPIPTMAHKTLVEFLDLQSMTTEVGEMPSSEQNTNSREEQNSHYVDLENVSEMLHDCDIYLEKLEKQILCAKRIVPILHHRRQVKHDESPSISTISSSQTNKIAIDKLKSLMMERDTMHSSLVASRVLHAHEMDSQRKRFQRLESKLKAIEELNDRSSAPGAVFFLGQPTIPDINSLTKNDRNMIQDVEVELSGLCNQLASAISSRVSAELEITRMAELQQTNEAILNNEISKLKEELLLANKISHEESLKRKIAEQECQKWKESFEALLHSSSSHRKE
eukprot:CAMPEP_0176478374 /NCGR_PEP_ID=MMETSP0200_2-20121128/1149_1 /TAXON_ID=947934 /ORGANISM="Chaetoceros sp., Strain GSL56" /LENGTH=1917 /DNA_ID=CAMNT_0017874301 /DNA_START=31 /DNA_END=5784 /DNA_ORIENTATION=+